MKNAFRLHRVLAMDLADGQRTDACDFKTEFGYARFLLSTTIQYSAAEGIRLVTEGIEKVDLPLKDYIAWLNETSRRFDIDGNPLRAYPYTLYVMYLLPKFTKTAFEFIDYQQRIRLVWSVSLASAIVYDSRNSPTSLNNYRIYSMQRFTKNC